MVNEAVTEQAKKVGMINLGCPKNQVDAEVMLGQLKAEGYELTPDAAEAEVIIVNTCGFIDAAKQESIDAILEMAELKNDGTVKKLIATGCLTQRYGEALAEGIPELDAVVGTGAEGEIAATVAKVTGGSQQLVQIGHPGGAIAPGQSAGRLRVGPGYSAYVKIAEGCSKRCAFCIIPQLRGDLVSRSVEDIVDEVRALVADGVVEINLISQDTTNYGVDRYNKKMLAELVKQVAAVDGLRWLRLLYTYPTDYTDELLKTLGSTDKVVPYIDLPLQHADTGVLKRMNRRGSLEGLNDLVGRIRQTISGVALRSSFIVGFPGETEEEFDTLYNFIAENRFDSVGVFTYSHEEGTSAYDLEDDVPDEVKQARKDALMTLQAEISAEKLQSYVGQTIDVLVHGLSEESDLLLEGRAATQAPDVDGLIYINDGVAEPGDIVRVVITEADTYDLVGHIEGAEGPLDEMSEP
jgi:ribosomal protein S12 methylthiotransferase